MNNTNYWKCWHGMVAQTGHPKFRFLKLNLAPRAGLLKKPGNAISAAHLVAGKGLCCPFCFLGTDMWLFIHSPSDHGLSAPALQPGVCRYGTKLACCYGWRKSSKGVCEGNFITTQTTLCSRARPGPSACYL